MKREIGASRRREVLAKRVTRERRELGLRPWQLAPSEVNGEGSPWPEHTIGAQSWAEAQRMRAEIRKRSPRYFR